MKFQDYYETLGVARTATQDEIKQSYRKLARKYHPDVSKEAGAEERFKQVGEAFAVLKDPEKRAAYDQMGSQWKSGQDFTPPPDWNSGFEFNDGNHGGDQSEFFESLFGRQARGGQRQQRRSANMNFKGQDHHAKIMIDLNDSFQGAKRSINLQMPAYDANGNLVAQERKLDVTIPKGIRAGQNLRLAGQGGPGMGEGGAGDLYLEIAFHPHSLYRVDGRDIYMDLPLTPWEAALGASVTVPTPDGPVAMNIPANSSGGRKLRLKGRGIPGKEAGDLYAVLTITLPPADSEAHKEAYSNFAKAFDFNPRA